MTKKEFCRTSTGRWGRSATSTYTMGNLYAAQFFEAIRNELPDLDDRMRRGEFGALLNWLRANIHAHGRRWSASDLCRRISGSALSHEPLMRHLRDKLRPLYGLPPRP